MNSAPPLPIIDIALKLTQDHYPLSKKAKETIRVIHRLPLANQVSHTIWLPIPGEEPQELKLQFSIFQGIGYWFAYSPEANTAVIMYHLE